MLSIRPTDSRDAAAIREVTVAAFSASEFGYHGEADLVETLTESAVKHASWVATSEGQLVGHILFTPVLIRSDDAELHGMGLAPMSVLPSRQRQGVGAALVRYALSTLFADGCPFVVVLGHPEYYPRFGFEPAADFGVTHGFEGIPQEVFFLGTNPGRTEPLRPGKLFYDSSFGEQHAAT